MNVVATRGERNNNPTNINFMATRPWRGQIGRELVPAGFTYSDRFGLYDTVQNGIGAGAKQLLTDNIKHGLSCLYDLIADHTYGWAPGSDGNYPVEYAEFVDTFVKVGIRTPIDLRKPELLIPTLTGFIHEENGRCLYAADLIASACRDALGLSPGVTS